MNESTVYVYTFVCTLLSRQTERNVAECCREVCGVLSEGFAECCQG